MAQFKSIKSLQQISDGLTDISPRKVLKPRARPTVRGLFDEEEEIEQEDWVGLNQDGSEDKVTLPNHGNPQTLQQLEALEELDASIDRMLQHAGSTSQQFPLLVFSSCLLPRLPLFHRLRLRLRHPVPPSNMRACSMTTWRLDNHGGLDSE